MAVLVSPVVFSLIAVEPMAVLSEALALFLSAAAPIALFRLPVFKKSARKPMAMLKLPTMLLASASAPMAMFWIASGVALKCPITNRHVINAGSIGTKRTGTHGGIVDATVVMRLSSALGPTAVFPPGYTSLGQSAALSGGESANQQSAIASVKKPQRNGERLMDLISVFIVFCSFRLEVALLNA